MFNKLNLLSSVLLSPNEAGTATAATTTGADISAILASSKGGDEFVTRNIHIERPLITAKETLFSFRKTKDAITGEEIKKPSFKLALPVPTIDGLIESLSNQKIVDYVLDVLADEIKAAAKVQVDDETKPVNAQADLDLSKLTLEFLANQPKAERGGPKIPEEQWNAFSADYLTVMVAATGKTEETVKNGLDLFLKKLNPVKSQKQVVAKLQSLLATYATNSKNLDDVADVVEYLTKRMETLMSAEDVNLLETL